MLSRLWDPLCRIALLASLAVVALSVAAIAARFPLLGVVGLLGVLMRCRGVRGASTNYGSATMSTARDVERSGSFGPGGLILGRTLGEKPSKRAAIAALLSPLISSDKACRMMFAAFLNRKWMGGTLLRVKDYCHLASFSPAGGGKGVSVLIPVLRSYAGSCVVTDPKCELTLKTAKFRRKLGHKVFVLNPFGVAKVPSATLNPLDWIDHNSVEFLDQCRDLANMLVQRTGRESDNHWNNSCELVLTGIICFVCACETDRKKRTFQTVRGLLSNPVAFHSAKQAMQRVPGFHGVVQRLGGQASWFQGKELASVLTTVQRTTNFLDGPLIAANTESSSFDPMILRKRRATVYLVLPADKLNSLAPLLRMQIGTIMRRITSGTPTEKNPVLWLLDEYAHLGKVEAVEDAVTLLRGMGMRLWFFFQSRDQMKICFGDKASTVLDNIGTQQYFGINSYETAEELSKRIGETTLRITSESVSDSSSSPVGGFGPSGSQSGSRSRSRTVNSSEIARRLLKPEEIITLSSEIALIFHKNLPVIPARLVRYFNAPEFRWNGTGKQAGLGLAGGIAAAVLLAAALAFGAFAESVASLPPQASAGPSWQAVQPYPAQTIGQPYGGQARRTRRSR